MKVKELIGKEIKEIDSADVAKGFSRISLYLAKRLTGMDRAIIRSYFETAPVKKLHVGCGKHRLEGWLNADYFPKLKDVIRLDATKNYPFENNQFDYVFSEHMIEHISYPAGLQVLRECFRVLKPTGKIRISTPDLAFLVDLYQEKKSQLQVDFIKFSTDVHLKEAPDYQDTFVINNYVRNWGHTFIYDEKVLRQAMEKAGFTNIMRFPVSESQDAALQNLENVSRKPPGMIALESLVLEGTKP